MRESQCRNSKQSLEMKQRPWRKTAYLFAPRDLAQFAFLNSPGPPTHSGAVLPSVVLPLQSPVKKIPYGLVYRSVLRKHYLNCGSLFTDDCSLCQVGKKGISEPTVFRNTSQVGLKIVLVFQFIFTELCQVCPRCSPAPFIQPASLVVKKLYYKGTLVTGN